MKSHNKAPTIANKAPEIIAAGQLNTFAITGTITPPIIPQYHRLAALVPRSRVNLTRYHGVFPPNSRHRVSVTPARRGKASRKTVADQDEKTPVQSHVAMTGFCSCKPGIHAHYCLH